MLHAEAAGVGGLRLRLQDRQVARRQALRCAGAHRQALAQRLQLMRLVKERVCLQANSLDVSSCPCNNGNWDAGACGQRRLAQGKEGLTGRIRPLLLFNA